MKPIRFLLPAVMLLLSASAFSGAFQVAPVMIDAVNGKAEGNLIAARFSASESERIGCAVGYGAQHYAYCEATDADGVVAGCITGDPVMIETIASINTFSFVYFTWAGDKWDGWPDPMPECTHVTVATRSTHIPEKIEMEMELFD